MMRRLLSYLSCLFTALLMTACGFDLKEEPAVRVDRSLEGMEVLVSFSVPGASLNPATKTLRETPELNSLYVVVCGSNYQMREYKKAHLEQHLVNGYTYTTTEGGQTHQHTVDLYKFTVPLTISSSKRTLHFLGNGPEMLSLDNGYNVLPYLTSEENTQAFWQAVEIPGDIGLMPKLDGNGDPIEIEPGLYQPNDALAARLSLVPLIRNFAKIKVTAAEANTVDPAQSSNFEIISYAVINAPKRGTIAPYNSQSTTGFIFKADNEKGTSGYQDCVYSDLQDEDAYPGNMPRDVEFDTTVPKAAWFQNPDDPENQGRVIRYDSGTDHGFYIYERCKPTDALLPTSIIVYGEYWDRQQYETADQDPRHDFYYYKLDLVEGDNYYPVFRNFRYEIQIERIEAPGHRTPEAAANSMGNANVSSDVTIQHLNDISDGTARLVVWPWMAQTFVRQTDCDWLFAMYYDDAFGNPSTDEGAVTLELQPPADGLGDIIDPSSLHIDSPDGDGWRKISFSTVEPSAVTRSQAIRVKGGGRLYRDVVITLQEKQNLKVSCTPEIAYSKGTELTLSISIPHGLPDSMFPLEFLIEAEAKSLTPDNDKPGNNLPVITGSSMSDGERAGATTFQYIYTLTLDDYRALTPQTDAYGQTWCTFDCYFKSNRKDSATTIWVGDQNGFFNKNSTSFTNLPPAIINYFYVEAVGGCKVKLNGSNLEYKIDGNSWNSYTKNKEITVAAGSKMYFRSKGEEMNSQTNWQAAFSCTGGDFKVGGNLTSLLIGDDCDDMGAKLTSFNFLDFFKHENSNKNENLTDAYDLVLPMTTLSTEQCFKSFFHGCSKLVRGPKELPATNLSKTCYRNFFNGCTSLTYAPALMAETLPDDCYQQMFYGCNSLQSITMMASSYRAGNFTDWVKGITSTGDFYYNQNNTSLPTGDSGIPTGWTAHPVDPATITP